MTTLWQRLTGSRQTLSIFCDGSSHARGGQPGGWAFMIVQDDEALVTRSGGAKSTTNNRMELQAALLGLREVLTLPAHGDVELVSDSRYALEIADGTYLPKKDRDDALALRAACTQVNARTRWVRGHSGDRWNEAVDALAHAAKQQFVPARVLRKAAQRKPR